MDPFISFLPDIPCGHLFSLYNWHILGAAWLTVCVSGSWLVVGGGVELGTPETAGVLSGGMGATLVGGFFDVGSVFEPPNVTLGVLFLALVGATRSFFS